MPRDLTPFDAYAALRTIEACAAARSDLLAMRDGVVPIVAVRAIRGQILAALGDTDRLLAEMEGEPLVEARLRADADALTGVIVAFLRRHGEASARCAATAMLAEPEPMPLPATTRRQRPDPPIAVSTRIMRRDSEPDATVDGGPPARPRLPPADPDGDLPASDDFPADEDRQPPRLCSTPPSPLIDPPHRSDLDDALDVPVHDAPTFENRTRRTTDLTAEEEVATAMPQHASRPSEPPVRPTRTQIEINEDVAAAARAIDEAERIADAEERAAEEAEKAAMAARPPRDPMEDFRLGIRQPPFAIDTSRPGKLLVPRPWTNEADIDLFVRSYGLVAGPLVAQRYVTFQIDLLSTLDKIAALHGEDLPSWAFAAMERWVDAGSPTPITLHAKMPSPMRARAWLHMSERVVEALQRVGRAEAVWPIRVLRAVLIDATGSVRPDDADLLPRCTSRGPTSDDGYLIAAAYDQSYRLPS